MLNIQHNITPNQQKHLGVQLFLLDVRICISEIFFLKDCIMLWVIKVTNVHVYGDFERCINLLKWGVLIHYNLNF